MFSQVFFLFLSDNMICGNLSIADEELQPDIHIEQQFRSTDVSYFPKPSGGILFFLLYYWIC